MTRKKCRRKVRPLMADLMDYVTKGVTMIDGEMLDKLRAVDAKMLSAFREQRATLTDYLHAVDIMNLTEYMGRRGVGPEALEATDRLHGYLVEAAKRFEETGVMVLAEEGLTALKDVYEYHDLQRQCVDRATFERFLTGCKNYILSAGHKVVKLDVKEKEQA